ncbi:MULTISPECIES: hypothetical protein [Enterobacteriaceae]|uniref:Uncharacterized protein n=1 Tax=Cronobacter turicensis (strain DSM 18703 / CCUG 55852 / LMG 23827 / z3032) TaxID=693216 RepID=C9Y5N9_CROTZ|nr:MULTISPECIES: hypothetical protein [Enterobacteriaceae]EBC2720658.1 hypothetical protein [Salmonella enterica]EJD9060380.1 hypothetical protein [Salmonella enterica subsp. enterica serovar Anatum]CBA34684.1 hypothetical protein Ctu_2p00110 [Cronobacter turicensis z3032]EBD5338842.1 hypothetical protein [Salmonella enterica]EBF1827646.1 hypothetical protein [Salmonella enterica]
MSIPTLPGSVFSVIVRTAEYFFFNRKSRQRREAEAASQLVSVLDRFVVGCDAVAEDDGYPPFTNPEYHDYRDRTPQSETVLLAVPDIPGRELLPISISDRVRVIESLQNDTSRALMEARECDDGSGDGFYAKRQEIFSLLGFKAVELTRELRSAYRLSPPSIEHRNREKRIEEKLRYHDGFSVKIRRIEQRIARKAKMAAGKIT